MLRITMVSGGTTRGGGFGAERISRTGKEAFQLGDLAVRKRAPRGLRGGLLGDSTTRAEDLCGPMKLGDEIELGRLLDFFRRSTCAIFFRSFITRDGRSENRPGASDCRASHRDSPVDSRFLLQNRFSSTSHLLSQQLRIGEWRSGSFERQKAEGCSRR